MKKVGLMFIFGVFTMFLFSFSEQVSAQPTDAQIKKELTGAKTVLVTLGKPGKIEWSSTYKKYVWSRNFSAKLKTDEPDIFVIVTGYIVYDVMSGKYVKWRTFTTSNSYEGIPNPSESDVQALIKKFGTEKFMGNYYYNRVIGSVESIGMSFEPMFEWHTPMSVSFDVTAVYTERINDIGGKEKVARTFTIRLYADKPKGEWKNMISSPTRGEKTIMKNLNWTIIMRGGVSK